MTGGVQAAMITAALTKVLLLGTMLIEVDLGIKSLCERLPTPEGGWRGRHYWTGRAIYPLLLSLPVLGVFGASWKSIAVVGAATVFSATDRLLWGLQKGIHGAFGLRLRTLQCLQQILLIGLAIAVVGRLDIHSSALARTCWTYISMLPGPAKWGPYRTIAYALGAIWLIHPTNFLIRWLLNKDDDQFLVEASSPAFQGSVPQAHAEQAATHENGRGGAEIGRDTLLAGRVIGALERLTLLILIMKSEYGALGLVLAAKSMARYSGIQQHMMTAEYYLLGTLLSTLAALVVGLILLAL